MAEEIQNNFLINDIYFTVPPTSISVHKEGLNYSVKSLRTRSSVKVASGNGIYHAQVNLTIAPQDFLSLHRLICQVKNNPFVCVSNGFLKDSLDINSDDLFFTVMGVNVNNHPSSPGAFIVELDFRHFNNSPYIEELGFKDDVKYGHFDIGFGSTGGQVPKAFIATKQKNARDSLIYKRYCNWLQLSYLEKYFDLDIKEEIRPYITIQEEALLQKGVIGLHQIENKIKLIELIYSSCKYTSIKSREFVKLKLSYEIQKTINEMFEEASQGKSDEEAAKARFEKILNFGAAESARYLRHEDSIENGPGGFEVRTMEKESPIIPKTKYSNILKYGRFTNFSNTFFPMANRNFENENDWLLMDLLPRTEREEIESGYLFLPTDMFFLKHKPLTSGKNFLSFSLSNPDGSEGEAAEDFSIKGNFNSTLTKFTSTELKNKLPAGTIIASITDVEKPMQVRIQLKLFSQLPMYKEAKTKIQMNNRDRRSNFEKFKQIDEFISKNYQPYLGRKYASNGIFEKIKALHFLDFDDSDLYVILGGGISLEPQAEIQWDTSTVITGVNGSLRHITPSIPILGQEVPTHQFLGSMQPSYQMSLIGVGPGDAMPDSFQNLEIYRKISQSSVKQFNEVPDASNFAVSSLITKLLGSYEGSYPEATQIQYAAAPINYVKEKFNFSVNSVNTFTVEGQPNTYGLNIHFEEARSYEEEKIRPAFTNYAYDKDFSGDFFNTFLQTDIVINKRKPLVMQSSSSVAKRKAATKVRVAVPASTEEYKWMNWKTKYISSEEWYQKPRSYSSKSAARLKRLGSDVVLGENFEEEMKIVKKYFVNSPKEGEEWRETKRSRFKRDAAGKIMTKTVTDSETGETSIVKITEDYYHKIGTNIVNSKSYIDVDKSAYLLCKTVSTIIDYFKVLYSGQSIELKPSLTSTLRLNSDKEYDRKRGNHKIGTALDLDFLGINLTEAGIYIYLMQLLGYLPDLTDQGRTNAYLGMGFYGSKSHKRSTVMTKGDGAWLHLDLNAKVTKFVISEDEKEFVFHVPAEWNRGLRCWADSGYYFDGKERRINGRKVKRPHIRNLLKAMSSEAAIETKSGAIDSALKPFKFETMKTYRDRLKDAHEKLKGIQQAERIRSEAVREISENKNIINFWNEVLRPKLAEKDEVYKQPRYDLRLPDKCGANITIVDHDGKRHIINLKDEDATNINWYPASTIKLVAAIGSLYNIFRYKLYTLSAVKHHEEDGDVFSFGRAAEDAIPQNLVFQFKTRTGYKEHNYATLLSKAIKESDNVSYSLLVAIAERAEIIEWLDGIDSSVTISYPFYFNKWKTSEGDTVTKNWYRDETGKKVTRTDITWIGDYTTRANRWSGRGNIFPYFGAGEEGFVESILFNAPLGDSIIKMGLENFEPSTKKYIEFVHGGKFKAKRQGSSSGTVEDFSKILIDFIRRENLPLSAQDFDTVALISSDGEGVEDIEVTYNDLLDYEYAYEVNGEEQASPTKAASWWEFLENCFSADKGHNQNAAPEVLRNDLQNKLKRAIADKLPEIDHDDEYEIYHKPGLYREGTIGKVSDCLYFENDNPNKDSFGITLWGEHIGDSGEIARREYLTSETFGGGEDKMPLTELLAYCIKHAGALKTYIGANDE